MVKNDIYTGLVWFPQIIFLYFIFFWSVQENPQLYMTRLSLAGDGCSLSPLEKVHPAADEARYQEEAAAHVETQVVVLVTRLVYPAWICNSI